MTRAANSAAKTESTVVWPSHSQPVNSQFFRFKDQMTSAAETEQIRPDDSQFFRSTNQLLSEVPAEVETQPNDVRPRHHSQLSRYTDQPTSAFETQPRDKQHVRKQLFRSTDEPTATDETEASNVWVRRTEAVHSKLFRSINQPTSVAEKELTYVHVMITVQASDVGGQASDEERHERLNKFLNQFYGSSDQDLHLKSMAKWFLKL